MIRRNGKTISIDELYEPRREKEVEERGNPSPFHSLPSHDEFGGSAFDHFSAFKSVEEFKFQNRNPCLPPKEPIFNNIFSPIDSPLFFRNEPPPQFQSVLENFPELVMPIPERKLALQNPLPSTFRIKKEDVRKVLFYKGRGKQLVMIKNKKKFPLNFKNSKEKNQLKGIYYATPYMLKEFVYLCGWGLASPCGRFLKMNVNENEIKSVQRLPDIPNPRMHFKTAMVLGNMYLIGGTINDGFAQECEKFNLDSKQWTKIPSLNCPYKFSMCLATINYKLIFFGVFPSHTLMYESFDCLDEEAGWKLQKLAFTNLITPYMGVQISCRELLIFPISAYFSQNYEAKMGVKKQQ